MKKEAKSGDCVEVEKVGFVQLRKVVSSAIIFTFIFSTYSVFTPPVRAEESRPFTPDGPAHTNELTNLITVNGTVKVLIVTEGWGPLRGVSPYQDKDLWREVLLEMDDFHVDWYDGVPNYNLIKGYDLVIYDAGGYFYPLDKAINPLREYHFAGKPLIVVAPDVNYNWGSGVPEFCEDVLHIKGALGIMPSTSYYVYAGTGHPIASGLLKNILIPEETSWPDCFDPEEDAQGVLIQKYIPYTEFGVGSVENLPSYSVYEPLGLYALVAYSGSPSEGRVVTYGVPPAGLSDTTVAKELCKNTIRWVLEGLTEKQLLIQELEALNSETKDVIESQVYTLADLHTIVYLNTYDDPAWSFAKIGLGFLAGVVSGDFLNAKAPFLYQIAEPLYDYHVFDAYKVKKILDALDEVFDSLDPSLGEDTIRDLFYNALMQNMAVGSSEDIYSYEATLDSFLAILLGNLESLPESDDYEHMIVEVRRARTWMETIQSKEATIPYIDLSSGQVIEARTVGGLSSYKEKLEQELEYFEIEAKINDVSALTIIAGGLIKIAGWALAIKTLGVGTFVTVKTETVGSAVMTAGGFGGTTSSIAKDLTKSKAVSIIEFGATPALISDIESIGDVYCAIIDLIGKWDQKGEYAGECVGLTLEQDVYIIQPDILYFGSYAWVTRFETYVKGFVSLSSDKPATGRIIVEIFRNESDTLQAIIGNSIELQPNVCTMVPFTIPLWDFLGPSQDQKIYRVVVYSAVGTSLFGSFVKMFTVAKEDASVNQMSTQCISSSIGTGESQSELIETMPGTDGLYLTLDYPGSELDLHVFDSENRHVGVDYATGNVENQVPFAQYSGPDTNPEWIAIEGNIGNQVFTVKIGCVYAEGKENFTLSYAITSQSVVIEPANIKIAPGETATYTITLKNLSEVPSTYELTLSGLNPEWYEFSENFISLDPGSSIDILLEVSPPTSASLGNYSLNVTASGLPGSVSAILTLEKPPFLVSSWVTDSDFENMENFRIVFTPDKKTGLYSLTATNPGQFYFNILVDNIDPTTENITITYVVDENFFLKSARPIHVYSDLARKIDITEDCAFSDNTIIVENFAPGAMVYVTIHLDYVLKKTRWTKSQAEAWYSEHTFNVTADGILSSAIIIGRGKS